MRIKQASEVSGLSPDTIRYYEKEGILPTIARDLSGQRAFSKDNLNWMELLQCLRQTGMPMKDMSRYAQLVHSDDNTTSERIDILKSHQARLEDKRKELENCEALLKYKLGIYEAKGDLH
ncbi:MAG: MerR family transcriptional regulator [Lentilitoribacter sp.]